MDYFQCSPINNRQLIKYSKNIRKLFHISDEESFPIIDVIEEMQDNPAFLDFNYEIIEDDNSFFVDGVQALFSFDSNVLYIKESVFDGACSDEPISRFTLTHELCHFFLMKVTGREPKLVKELNKIEYFKDPEWQANRLAGLILVPFNKSIELETEVIMNKYKVSPECAAYSKLQNLRTYKKFEEKNTIKEKIIYGTN